MRFADVHDISPYRGTPTDELDEAWEELYRCKFCLHNPMSLSLTNGYFQMAFLLSLKARPQSWKGLLSPLATIQTFISLKWMFSIYYIVL